MRDALWRFCPIWQVQYMYAFCFLASTVCILAGTRGLHADARHKGEGARHMHGIMVSPARRLRRRI
jgi:hypothetical protein